MVRAKIEKDYIVAVKSNMCGTLRFEGHGYNEYWAEFGEVIEMDWEEVLEIKKRARGFFERNWIVIEPDEKYKSSHFYTALGVDKYYPDCDKIASFDDALALKTKELNDYISKISAGCKDNFISFIKGLIRNKDKRVDSKSKMETLSKALNCEFEV